MSIAQGTIHYDYPQVQLTDRPTFADFNPAFSDIDAKLYSLITDSSTMDGRVDTLETSMATAQNDISGLRTDVNLASAGVATNAEAITTLQATVGGHTATLKTKLDSVAVADAYDSEHGTYSVGDIVTYNGQRYKCTTAVTAAEPFDADKWQGEDIQTVIEDIYSDIASLIAISFIYPSAGAKVTNYGARIIHCGRFLIAFIAGAFTDSITTSDVLYTLPSGARPHETQMLFGINTNSAHEPNLTQFNVSTDGEITGVGAYETGEFEMYGIIML